MRSVVPTIVDVSMNKVAYWIAERAIMASNECIEQENLNIA